MIFKTIQRIVGSSANDSLLSRLVINGIEVNKLKVVLYSLSISIDMVRKLTLAWVSNLTFRTNVGQFDELAY